MRHAAAYITVLLVMFALDAVWRSTMVPALYRPMLAPLLAEKPRLVPALLFYVLYAAGVVALAVRPAAAVGGAGARGAVFGLVAYGTYDLTNQATLRGWPMAITLLDMAWGTGLTALAAALAALAARNIAPAR